jgi:hypothetical protein
VRPEIRLIGRLQKKFGRLGVRVMFYHCSEVITLNLDMIFFYSMGRSAVPPPLHLKVKQSHFDPRRRPKQWPQKPPHQSPKNTPFGNFMTLQKTLTRCCSGRWPLSLWLLATVYRVLMQFEQSRIVSRNHFETGKSVFELNVMLI